MIETAGRAPNWLIEKDSKIASSLTAQLHSGKAKKPLFLGLVLGTASLAFLTPIIVEASFLSSLLSDTASVSSADSGSQNSQTMPLLTPANNINPSPAVGGDIALVGGSALLPQDGPAGTVADVINQPSTSQISTYVVRPGDTLSGIASMFKVTQNTIIWANDIKGGIIKPGQTLAILPITGIQHVVAKGETLASLAKVYQSDAHDIAQYNSLSDSDSLTVGNTIIIPSAEASVASAGASSNDTTKVTATKNKTTKVTKSKSKSKPSMLELAREGKQTAPLHGANGPDLGDYYAWPLDGGNITQGLHGFDAVDIGAAKGTDIYAAAAGTVIIARGGNGWNGGYGNYIVIQHSNGTQTLYAHASRLLVSEGDTVTQGETIALVGATGEATGPHLHFEVRGAKNPFGDLSVGEGD